MNNFINPVLEKLGRRLRLGVVGGGATSFIGSVHRTAARLDDRFEVVASVMASTPERAREQGIQAGIAEDRAYGTLDEMLESEGQRDDGIDVVAIMTPNHRHYPECKAVLAKGLHIICDKPMTTSVADAIDLVKSVRDARIIFCFTHNYSGYPMVRQARAMVATGKIGEIRQVNVEYSQGQLSSYVEPKAPERLKWRLDPKRGGPSAVLGDIGTHAHQLLTYITGMPLAKLAADVGPTVPERQNDDYAGMLLRMENGARGTLWCTQAASGSENILRIKVFGSLGGLEWEQCSPNHLKHMVQGEPARILSRGLPGLSDAAHRASRIPTGHPEGFQEGFANLYNDAAEAIAARITGTEADPLALDFPTVEDGARGMRFLEAALESSNGEGGWVDCTLNF